MVEPSMEEGVPPLVSEDKNVDELASTSQQLENSSGPPLVDEVKTENGAAHTDEEGAAVEGSVADTRTEPDTVAASDTKSKADNQEDMTKKVPASSAKRLIKPASQAKPGIASVAKPGSMGTSVKKILNSGAFGSTQTKPTTVSKTSTSLSSSTTKPPPTPALKRSSSISSTTSAAKPPTSTTSAAKPPTSTTKTSAITSTSMAARRTSMAPPAPKSLSSSTSLRPLSTTSTKASPVAGTTRTSATSQPAVADPVRSSSGLGANRPRASVSEGVPAKKPGAPRPSLSAAKISSASGMKLPRTTGSASISSIKEVREDGKAVQDLEAKYKDAASSLESNLQRVKELKTQIEAAKSTVASTEAERDEKQHALEVLQTSKASLEVELKVAQDGLEEQRKAGETQLLQVKEELLAARDTAATQTTLIATLQEQLSAVEAELVSAREAVVAAKSLHESAIAEAGSMDREALLKAQADLEAFKAESDAIIAAQTKAQEGAAERVRTLESEVEMFSELSTAVDQLKKEKEEVETRLSEVEIEILENRESLDMAGEEKDKALARLKAFERERAAAEEANAAAAEASRFKEEKHAAVLESLTELGGQLATARESYEALQAQSQAKEVEHAQMLAEVQRLHEESSKVAAEETQRIKADLEGQEAKYTGKLDEVKAEHANLLEQAFQKAKSEAGAEHSVELQNLRARSQATIEQMRQAHQASLEDAQASHQEELESQVNVLEKQVSNLKLELKATQDDLAKAKAGLEAALALEGTLKRQIEQKDAEAAAAHVPVDQSEQVARLTKELANAKDDLLNLTEAFNASRESFQQISNNHQLELEEAAKSRAEEVTKLRETHEEEGGAFKRERDELTSRVSELEVELATLRATAEAQPAAAPLSPRKDTNGAVPGSSAVTKEELQRMHEAHNLKLYELETSHEQSVKGLTEKLEAATQEATDQQALADRLQMELNFSEQSAEDHEDELKQLRDEIEHLKVQLQLAGAGP